MTIRAIIFDFGNVINKWQPEKAFSAVYATPEAVEEAFERFRFKDWVGSVMDAGDDVDASIATISTTEPERATFLQTYLDRIEMAHATPVPGTSEIVEACLSRKDLKVLGMTNAGEAAFQAMKGFSHIISRMDDVFVSAREKLMKPDARAFELLLSRNGLAPQDCVFIDDSPKNAAGAASLGITAIRFKNAAQLRLGLTELRILP